VRAPSRVSFRTAVCAAVATMAAFALVACGDSDDDSDQKLSVTLSGDGKAAKFTTPESAEAGVAEITFTNNSDETADMQLIRVEGDHSAAEVIQGLGKAIEGAPFEDWFFGGGGIGETKTGQSATVTQVLEPGTYYAFNTETDGPPDPSAAGRIDVTGETSDEELEADSVVTAEDADDEYSFAADGLEAGKHEILFENAGEQPHHLLISPIKGDATAEEVETAFKEEKGPPPLEEKGSQSTAVIEGGEGQLVTVDLSPGRYAFYCFITDRDGGKPHALKGMVDEFEVE
jgi:hypothetical protein